MDVNNARTPEKTSDEEVQRPHDHQPLTGHRKSHGQNSELKSRIQDRPVRSRG